MYAKVHRIGDMWLVCLQACSQHERVKALSQMLMWIRISSCMNEVKTHHVIHGVEVIAQERRIKNRDCISSSSHNHERYTRGLSIERRDGH